MLGNPDPDLRHGIVAVLRLPVAITEFKRDTLVVPSSEALLDTGTGKDAQQP